MQISDHIGRPTGTLELFAWRGGKLVDGQVIGGELVEHTIEHNLVVDAYKVIAQHLIGGDVTGKSITQIAFGTNGTAPAGGNTAITGAYTKGLDSHSYPDATSVSFAFSLGSTEANGIAILEFGLLTADGTLWSRKTRTTALNKASDITLTGSWVIQFN